MFLFKGRDLKFIETMDKDSKCFVAGHQGLVGSALVRKLNSEDFSNLIVCDRSEVDLLSQAAVQKFFSRNTPDLVIIAAAMVGGINANRSYPADFIRNNLH